MHTTVDCEGLELSVHASSAYCDRTLTSLKRWQVRHYTGCDAADQRGQKSVVLIKV